MKKKKVGLAIIAAAIIIGIGGYGVYKLNLTHVKKQISKNETKVQKEVNSYTKKKEKNTTIEVKKVKINPNAVSPAIAEIDKGNYDTDRWWNASQQQLLNHLENEAKKYNSKEIQSIVDNSSKIPSYLIQLAVMHPESIPLVAGYPTKKINQPIDISSYYTKGKIPLFEQFDKQWGYDWYGNGPICMDGCGPTSVAMVAVGLTGNTNINPRVVADYSAKHGGYTWNRGSNSTLMTNVAKHFGIQATEINVGQVRSQLAKGHPIIVSLGPGKFTLTGHIMVLSGVTPDGKILIKDPDSIKFSNQSWNLSDIADSARAYYAYTKI